MSSLRLAYLRSHNIAAPVIRARFWSDWAHCGVLTPDETLIHASIKGVVEAPWESIVKTASKLEVVFVACPHAADGIKWARAQLGKPYDWGGALGVGFNRKWEDPEKWFCSEFIEAALVAAGRRRFREDTYRIDPQTSYSVI